MNTDNWLCTSWMPKSWDTSVERVADAHDTPTASILSQFWLQQMESAISANCHGWFAPAHCPCVSLLQTHSVWWRPIKAGGGRGGTRQAFKIASMWERNHVLSLSGCKKRCWDPTLSSFQHEMPPFAEPTPGPAPHLWHKKVSNQFDFNVNQNHLSISISPNVSHIDQIPLISCTSH
jgi:hypothetical protein